MNANSAAARGRRFYLAAAGVLVLLGATTAAAQPAAPAVPGLFAAVIHAGPDATLPRLLNRGVVERLLQRMYPPRLWDDGVTGHTEVLLLVSADGRVQPGSVRVQNVAAPAFREAAARVAERFRFEPARVNGAPVAMEIVVPIDWRLEP